MSYTGQFLIAVVALVIVRVEGQLVDPRIAGGSDAPQGQYPFMVSLHYVNPVDNSSKHICGATILSENWALTAGGCIIGPNFLNDHFLYSGSVDLESGGRTHLPIQVEVHEDYFLGGFDIAVIKVDPPFDFTDPFKWAPVSLPQTGFEVQEGLPATVLGWGQETPNTSTVQFLKAATISTIDDSNCSMLTDPANMICAGTSEGNIGHCYGDNGGPLIVDGVQLGIVSYSIACESTLPSIFTQVSSYIDWIATHTV
ncbi:chymotrypsin-2-like [Cloeon dipterum]|uniref:chymotrypsin-2-like n=1 Tax=Cloeon dipterum TaxID=197152 RepID=UPI00321F8271